MVLAGHRSAAASALVFLLGTFWVRGSRLIPARPLPIGIAGRALALVRLGQFGNHLDLEGEARQPGHAHGYGATPQSTAAFMSVSSRDPYAGVYGLGGRGGGTVGAGCRKSVRC